MSQKSNNLEVKEISVCNDVNPDTRLLFEAVYRDKRKIVNQLVLSRIDKPCDAEDLVHDAFVRMWEYRENIDEKRSLAGLLYRVTMNIVANYSKHENVGKRYKNQMRDSCDSVTVYPDFEHYFNEITSKIDSIIVSLPKAKKEIFLLFWEKGMTGQQIATDRGISVRTVENQIYRVKRKLKEELIFQLALVN